MAFFQKKTRKDSSLSLSDNDKEQRYCNKCGRPLDIWDIQEDFSMHRYLGYGTKYDEFILDLQLCCDCVENLIDKCVKCPINDNTYWMMVKANKKSKLSKYLKGRR